MTIQQKITKSIEIIIKEKVNLIGSGRTDTGVHAIGQVANFRTEQEIDIYKFKHSLNSILPKDIAVMKMGKVDEKFHSRFDAKRRIYFYLIIKYKSPFYSHYSYFYHGAININSFNRLSKMFIGSHDFTSFCQANSETEKKLCTIYDAHWKEIGGLVFFRIEADRFLHGMVRTIVGTILSAVKNNFDEGFIKSILSAEDREAAGETVPAKGLFLFKVKY